MDATGAVFGGLDSTRTQQNPRLFILFAAVLPVPDGLIEDFQSGSGRSHKETNQAMSRRGPFSFT